MSVIKQVKDWLFRAYLGEGVVPSGLVELTRYLASNKEGINFVIRRENDVFIAVSSNFRFGSIITEGETEQILDENIQDAILTAFSVPSSYRTEAHLVKIGGKKGERVYAAA